MQSLKELYRIGMGPSSSHTMAPRRAAQRFFEKNPQADFYEVTLYGSLAATGKGHFTDQAILDVLGKDKTQILWQKETVLPFHTNAMKFDSFDANRNKTDSWTVYSVGGGALREEGEPPAKEVYEYKTFADIVSWAEKQGRPIWTIVFDNEGEEIRQYLSEVWDQMQTSVQNGLEHEDVLPGGLRLARKAYSFYKKALAQRPDLARTGLLSAYSLAVSEENAGRGIVVTAPTCGSCGVVSGMLYYLKHHQNFNDREIINALATAGLVGNIVKDTNLQLSGRKMTFDNRLPQGVVVRGNQSLLYSVFRNLTDNAIAYAGDGTTITLSASPEGDCWHFTFSDNGVGVPYEHLPRLFERFYRVDKGRSRKMGGTGLGLAIVKNSVLLHGGTITVNNNITGGLRFDFTLKK